MHKFEFPRILLHVILELFRKESGKFMVIIHNQRSQTLVVSNVFIHQVAVAHTHTDFISVMATHCWFNGREPKREQKHIHKRHIK